ncbi:MAG: ABC transporter permease subunit [Alphaproteobacteria bacterium]|nr:ABC transporter permease subunit [Alphaproteobacteria bacterium]
MSGTATQQKLPGSAATAWLSLAFLYVPILVVIVFSFNASRLITVWEGFSTDWYRAALANDDLRRATMNSLIVGVSATFVSTLIALLVALALRGGQAPKKARQATMTLMTLPLLIPEIVIAIASLIFFAAVNMRLGLGNVLVAHIVFCIPFAYSPIKARILTIPPALFEAAADLYATPWRVFRRVTLPLLMPGITAGAMLAFITSLDDFIITQMVAPPGAMTLPVYIYSMVRKGITPEINAISSLLLVVSMMLVLASYLVNQKKAA